MRWPHQHVGMGECTVSERHDDAGTVVLSIKQADARVMVASSLLATAEAAALPHVQVDRPTPDRAGAVHLHTPLLTVTYRLDRYCAACDAWEATRA